MTDKSIKSGKEVVAEFIDSLESMEGVDEYTRNIIKSLHSEGSLTHTKLQQALAQKRQELLENDKD